MGTEWVELRSSNNFSSRFALPDGKSLLKDVYHWAFQGVSKTPPKKKSNFTGQAPLLQKGKTGQTGKGDKPILTVQPLLLLRDQKMGK